MCALAAFLVAVASSLSAAPVPPTTGPDDHVVGVPWRGGRGITETVAEIMARDRQHGLAQGAALGGDTEPEIEAIHTFRDLPRQENPLALQVSQWPEASLQVRSAVAELSTPQTVATSFLATQFSESLSPPPDSMGAVGPTQVLVIVNGRIKSFSKTGGLGSLNVSTQTFFSSVRDIYLTSDPQLRYDRLSGRWFVTMMTVFETPNRIMIAVSSDATITDTSSFTFFQFQHDLVGVTPNADTGGFADYPTLGVDEHALYIGINVFDTPMFSTTGFVINKADLLAGTLTVTAFRQLGTLFTGGPITPQGVDDDDPAATEGYFIGVDSQVRSQLDVRRVFNPGGVPSISGNLTVTVPTTAYPIVQPALGSTKDLDSIDDRLFAAAIHTNKLTGVRTLWTAHNIEVNGSGVGTNGGGRNGSRWYEIKNLNTSPALNQSGTLFDATASNPRGFWMPTVAMSGQGHMALGCSTAGPANFAEVAVAGRLASDPPGTTQAFTLAQSSATAYNRQSIEPQRWGDYSHVVVDPTDDMTMWTFQEYCNATNSWGVQAIRLAAPPPATVTATSPSSVAPGQSSIAVTIIGVSSGGSGFFDPGADPGGPGFANHLAAVVSGGVTVNSVTFVDATHVTLDLSTVGATEGVKQVTVTNPDGQSSTGTLTVSEPTTGLCKPLGLNNPCVPGGAGRGEQCFLEWAPSPIPPRRRDLTPNNTLVCYEGDPRCDIDGANNCCTIQTRLCINNSDLRLPECTPSDVAAFEVRSPALNSPDPINQINRQALEAQGGASGFGVSVYRGKTRQFTGLPNAAPDSCSALVSLRVPLRMSRGRAYSSQRRLSVKITDSLGKVEFNRLRLVCRKSTCGDGKIQSDHEECDQGSGNRVDGDGCNAGCQVEPGWQCAGVPSICTSLTPLPTRTRTSTATPSWTPVPQNTATPTDTITPGGPTLTPTFIPRPCVFGAGTSATLSARLFVVTVPVSGSQIWRFGLLQPDSTRPLAILPSESHFDCASTSIAGNSVRFCARLDPTTYCQGGPNDGLQCPPAVCGLGNACDIKPGRGAVDCAPGGGSLSGTDSLVQVDHNTNQSTVAGQPNIGLPADPSCTHTFLDPNGAVLNSCLEGSGPTCSGGVHTHPGVCNSPIEQTLSGVSPAGGFTLTQPIDLNVAIGGDCSLRSCFCAVGTCNGGTTPGARCGVDADCGGGTCGTANGSSCTTNASCFGTVSQGVCAVCPPESCPLQTGEYQITTEATSGYGKAVIWNVNDTALIIGTTGAGNGANICGSAFGGPVCSTTTTGTPLNLTSVGGSCLGGPASVPPTVSGAVASVAYPAIDLAVETGDFIFTLTLQCQ